MGHSALLQLLLRVMDCSKIRFGPEWEASAPLVGNSEASEESNDFLVHLPPLLQSLLRRCGSVRSGTTTPGETDEDEDRAWALRLLLLRVFMQRAEALRPLAGRGLVDFVAESVADRRFLDAKRFHYWLRWETSLKPLWCFSLYYSRPLLPLQLPATASCGLESLA